MTPVNNKSLLHFIYDQMEKLDNKQIDVNTAKAQADLAKQANNVMKYEIDRANMLMKLDSYNKENKSTIKIRDIESKNFE